MSIRRRRPRGITLIELIVFIVIVSVGLAGVLVSLNVSVKGSADPLQPKQALAIAEALLEEILLKDYCDPSLPSAISLVANLTAGNNVISGIAVTTGISAGWQVVGSGIPGSATVTTVGANSLTLTSNALATASAVAIQAAACESVEGGRNLYDNVRDYDGYAANPVTLLDGTTVPGYAVAVSVPAATVNLNGVTARQITVTVTTASGATYSLTGHRAPY